MKITALAALVAMWVTTAGAGASAAKLKDPMLKNAAETVQICSDNTADNGLNFRARSIAPQMFAGIGVGIEWRKESSCPAGALRISYSTSTPANPMAGALAYALPYEGTHIVVFYDRVQATVEPNRVTALLAHEVTHILEGTPRHSAEGVVERRAAHRTASASGE